MSGLMLMVLAAGERAYGVVFISTGDPAYNTTEPEGSLAGSGWQWQAMWGGFTGTPIGPHHFITAKHVGGAVGSTVVFDGVTYSAIEIHDHATSDLRICKIDGTFPTWAPLYTSSDEVGKSLVVFGRGLVRGAEVRVGGVLKGWQWGGSGGTLRWGQNTVVALYNQGGSIGELLVAKFDASGGVNEAHLSTGDSAGAVFIQEAGVWKLAGINYSVDAYFNTTNSGGGFGATLFDVGGLYWGTSANWQYVTDQAANIPTGFYSTRISAHIDWINSVVSPPSPENVPAAGMIVMSLMGLVLAVTGARNLRGVSHRKH